MSAMALACAGRHMNVVRTLRELNTAVNVAQDKHMMCDYLEYSIVAPEHCVFVPKLCLTQEQLNLLGNDVNKHVHGFRTNQISWEFTITYYARSYYIHSIGIKNIHGVVTHRESGMDEPLAEIVIWRWNSYKQEIIKKELFKRNENRRDISLTQHDAYEVYFIIRLIEKRKPVKDVCSPSELLPSDAFTISIGEQTFVVSAHRLMQISPVFRAMLTDEMSEKASRKVEVKDAEPEHFRAFLELIDPDRNVLPNPTNVMEVLKLADRYQVNLAKDRCEMYLLNCVEMPLIELLKLAETYGLNKLKDSILSIGSVKLRAFYLSNSIELQEEGQFSRKFLDKLTLRLCYTE